MADSKKGQKKIVQYQAPKKKKHKIVQYKKTNYARKRKLKKLLGIIAVIILAYLLLQAYNQNWSAAGSYTSAGSQFINSIIEYLV